MASQSYHINTDYYCRHSIVVAVGRITDSFRHRSQRIAVDLGSNELGHAHRSRMDCSGHHNIFIDLIADAIMQPELNCYLLAHHHPLLRAKTFRRSWARRATAIITVVNQQTSTQPCPNQRLLIDHLVRSLSRGPHRSFSLWDDDS